MTPTPLPGLPRMSESADGLRDPARSASVQCQAHPFLRPYQSPCPDANAAGTQPDSRRRAVPCATESHACDHGFCKRRNIPDTTGKAVDV